MAEWAGEDDDDSPYKAKLCTAAQQPFLNVTERVIMRDRNYRTRYSKVLCNLLGPSPNYSRKIPSAIQRQIAVPN